MVEIYESDLRTGLLWILILAALGFLAVALYSFAADPSLGRAASLGLVIATLAIVLATMNLTYHTDRMADYTEDLAEYTRRLANATDDLRHIEQ